MTQNNLGRTPMDIESVVVTYGDSGEVVTLTTRGASPQHFFPEFNVGNDVIQLRFDWKDVDSRGQPMLDADFKDGATGNHRSLKGDRQLAHHTESLPSDGRVYKWVFRGFSREFNVAITWCVSVSETAKITESLDAVITRGANISETTTSTDSSDARIIRAADQKSGKG